MDNKKTIPTQSSSGKSNTKSNPIKEVSQASIRKFFMAEIFFFVYHFARLIIILTVVVLVSQSNLNQLMSSNSFYRLREVQDIWGQDVIIDIKAISSYNCPEGYSQMIGYRWPGTTLGCVCKSYELDYEFTTVLQGNCPLELLQVGCIGVKSQKQIPISFWLKDKLLCMKKVKNLNFYFMDQQGKLPKRCSIGTDYEINTADNMSCPITSLSSKNKKLIEVIQGQNPYNTDQFFTFQRQDNYPIVGFIVSQDSFCPQYGKKNISPNKTKNYILELQSRKFCNDILIYGPDPRIIELDSLTESQLYRNNQRLAEVINRLPAYQLSQSYKYKLGFVRYPPWSYQCRKSATFNLLQVRSHLSLKGSQQNILAYTVSSIFLFMTGILFTIFFVIRRITQLRIKYNSSYLYQDDFQIAQNKPNLLKQRDFIFQFFSFFFMLLIGCFGIIPLSIFNFMSETQVQWFKGAAVCSTGYLLSWIQSYKLAFEELRKNILLCIVIYMGLIVLDVGYMIWRIAKGDLKRVSPKIYEDYHNQEKEKIDIQVSVTQQAFIQRQSNQIVNNSEIEFEKLMISGFQQTNKRNRNLKDKRSFDNQIDLVL